MIAVRISVIVSILDRADNAHYIRDYTSVAVNWTERTLAFTNEPSPIRRNTTGKQTGIDRGCVHTLALSNGTMLDMPQPSERERREYLRLQRKLARQDTTNSRRGGKTAKFQSKRRKLTLKRMSSIRRRINNRKDDWVAKTTARLPGRTTPCPSSFYLKIAVFPKSRAGKNTRKMPLLRNRGAERS